MLYKQMLHPPNTSLKDKENDAVLSPYVYAVNTSPNSKGKAHQT